MAEEIDIQVLLRELGEERQKRESLERRVEEAERASAIRAELQRLGVVKIDLAYRAVKDDIPNGAEMKEYLAQFVGENPELLPARLSGGSGASSGQMQRSGGGGAVDLEKIRPGMSSEEMDRVRQEIARVASQTLRGF